MIDVDNLKGKFVLFRRSQHDAQFGGFSLLCAKVIEENGDYENPQSYKPRCTGGTSAPKEPWSLLLKRMEIVPRRGPKLGTMELKREEYGCPPAVRFAEQTKNWSTWHMTDKQQQKLVEGAGQKFKGQRSNFSQCYVDFNNPDHGFTVVDITCSFTVQKILDRYCVARIRKDKLIARELDHLLEVWKEEDKNGRKRFRTVKGKGKQKKAPSGSQPNVVPEEEEEEEGDETDVRIDYVSPNIAEAMCRVEEDEEEGQVSEEEDECSEEFPASRTMPNDKETRAVLELIDRSHQSKTCIVPVALSSSSSSNDHTFVRRTSSSSSSSLTQKSKRTKVTRIEDEMN